MPEGTSAGQIGSAQGVAPRPDEPPTQQPPITHEDAASAGPHDGDHQVVINLPKEN